MPEETNIQTMTSIYPEPLAVTQALYIKDDTKNDFVKLRISDRVSFEQFPFRYTVTVTLCEILNQG